MKTFEVSTPSGESKTFHKLSSAKAFMKDNPGSEGVIYKYWANGDWECVGRINLQGSNKTFVDNSRQRVASY